MGVINIKEEFSDTPGGRLKSEGAFSGEEFRNELLVKRFNEAAENNEKLIINFDGCFGFGTSFLEEAFGGLVRINGLRNVLDRIELISNEDETIPDLIRKYIQDAEKKKGWS